MSNTMGTMNAGEGQLRSQEPGNNNGNKCCIICENDHDGPQAANPRGTNKKSKTYADKVRANHGFKKQKGQESPWQDHPWYAGPESFSVHHLIEGQAVEGQPWNRWCCLLGYNINTLKNLVCLPLMHQLACVLAVPLHNGNHNTAPTDEPVDEHAGSSGPYLNYPDAVRRKLAALKSDIASDCISPSNFIKHMDQISLDIFTKIKGFHWHLREDGPDYRPGGPGCRINATSPHGECTARDISNNETRRTHSPIRQRLADRPTFKLELGK